MFYNKLLNFFFPKDYTCNKCGCEIFDQPKGFCNNCIKTLPFILGKVCLHCSNPMTADGYYCNRCKGQKFYVDRAVAPFSYDKFIKKMIYGLKYGGKVYNAKPLAEFMVERFNQTYLPFDIIVPVPLCSKRLKRRGYNQAQKLADEVANIYGTKSINDILIRIKETPSQTNLSVQSRKENMVEAFKVVNKNAVLNKVVLLIDDVYTSGATTSECAKMLKAAGAKAVYALTAAHTLKQKIK